MVVIAVDAEESLPSTLTDWRMIDPTPLESAEAAACVMIGRPIWDHRVVHGTELLDRLGLLYAGHGTTPTTLLPEHQCGARFANTLQRPRKPAVSPTQPTNDQSHQPDLLDALATRKEAEECPF